MKNLIALIILLVSFSSIAQEKTTKDIEKFTEIKAFDQIQVTLIKSDKNQVVLTGEDQGDVDIENNHYPRRIIPSRIEAYKSEPRKGLAYKDLMQDVKTELKDEDDTDEEDDNN